jgi:NAD(P)-dependent dehydrogenase (short-subunit alcohol dehydrogenase family)
MVNSLDKFSLENKTALVTGAAGLLGREHSLALAEAGAMVIVSDLYQKDIDEALAALKKELPEGKFTGIPLDVTSEESIQRCLKIVINECGQLDILVNNAAIDPKVTKDSKTLEKSRLENFDLSNWNFQLEVGLTGAMLCSKHFGYHMAQNKGGVILNIASDLSVFSPDQRIYRKNGLEADQQPVKPVTYSVIKHGLIGLTKYLSTYWAEQHVRVNALSPGGVFNNHPKEFVEKLTGLIPQKRMANKNEYRSAVQFLCSNASSYMTGQNIIMDGGRSVW